MKSLIVLPTYNEKENLPVVLAKVLGVEDLDVLVVDDNSTDGTREIARGWAAREGRIHLMERPGKLGLGTAYIEGFRWGLERGYDCFMEMDSDLSHNPLDIPRFLDEMRAGRDLVIGSRYVGGTISVVGWDFRRLLLSRFGNLYATTILRCPLSDMTSGFRAFSRRALDLLDLDRIHSEGYAFQIEMAYYIWIAGLDVSEVPIVFTERLRGSSKMSKQIVREAIWLPWRIRVRRMLGRLPIRLPEKPNPRGGQ
jgi:dolichol-phosphate mannosyltransferase